MLQTVCVRARTHDRFAMRDRVIAQREDSATSDDVDNHAAKRPAPCPRSTYTTLTHTHRSLAAWSEGDFCACALCLELAQRVETMVF